MATFAFLAAIPDKLLSITYLRANPRECLNIMRNVLNIVPRYIHNLPFSHFATPEIIQETLHYEIEVVRIEKVVLLNLEAFQKHCRNSVSEPRQVLINFDHLLEHAEPVLIESLFWNHADNDGHHRDKYEHVAEGRGLADAYVVEIVLGVHFHESVQNVRPFVPKYLLIVQHPVRIVQHEERSPP